jgi:hypothetical protein
LDRFQYIEPSNKKVGECIECKADIYEETLAYKCEDGFLCDEHCKDKYADKVLDIAYGVVNKYGEIA